MKEREGKKKGEQDIDEVYQREEKICGEEKNKSRLKKKNRHGR